jgi:Zn-dependent M28 family amino/carboxypeptidase
MSHNCSYRMIAAVCCLVALGGQTLVAQAPATFTAEAEPLSDLVEHATQLDQPSADARFDALIALLDEHGLAYEIQAFPNRRADEAGPAHGRNVSVTIGTGDREIIVGAHADAAMLRDGSLSHAMVDNAGAVAVLARVAQTLATQALRHRVRVLFFDLEELNLLGSEHLVGTLDPSRIAGMINVDIAGYGDTVLYGPAVGEGNDVMYAAMRHVCADASHRCLEFAQFPPSDDRSFQAVGIPNISLGTLTELEAHQLWLMLNAGPDSGLADGFVPPILRTIHTPADTADKLDAAGMTLAYNVVMGLILELDRSAR